MKLAPRAAEMKQILFNDWLPKSSWQLGIARFGPARRKTCLWTIYIAGNISATFCFLAVLPTTTPKRILRHWKGRNSRGFLESTFAVCTTYIATLLLSRSLHINFLYVLFSHACVFTSSLVNGTEWGWKADISSKIKYDKRKRQLTLAKLVRYSCPSWMTHSQHGCLVC